MGGGGVAFTFLRTFVKRISSKSINTSVRYSKIGHIYLRNYFMKKVIRSTVNSFLSLNFPVLFLIGHKTNKVSQTKSAALLQAINLYNSLKM